MSVQREQRQRNGCPGCGLPGASHASIRDCVLALRTQCDHLRADHERNREIGIRQMCRIAGYSLTMVGTVLSLGNAIVHLAIALPVYELPARSGFLGGLATILAGVLLVGGAQGWFIRRRSAGLTPVATLTVRGSI
jgi:hypothetical protein